MYPVLPKPFKINVSCGIVYISRNCFATLSEGDDLKQNVCQGESVIIELLKMTK